MISSQALARYLNSCILELCTLNFSDAGRLAAGGDRALAASGGALWSPSARGRQTISGAGSLLGEALQASPAALSFGIPLRCSPSRTAWATAIDQSWLRPSARSQQRALAARRPPGRRPVHRSPELSPVSSHCNHGRVGIKGVFIKLRRRQAPSDLYKPSALDTAALCPWLSERRATNSGER